MKVLIVRLLSSLLFLVPVFSSAEDLSIAERFTETHGHYSFWKGKKSASMAYDFSRGKWTGQANFGISEFGIQRTGCYGRCPSYSLLFNVDGSVRYEGFHYVEHKGVREGHIGSRHFYQVLRLIEESNFEAFDYNYSIPVTDSSSTFTLVVQDDTEKIVRNYAGAAPATVWAIENAIDELMQYVVWIDPDAEPKVSLKCSRGIQLTQDKVMGGPINPQDTTNLEYFYGGRQFGSKKGQHDWTWGPIDPETGEKQFHIQIYASEIGGTYWDSKTGLRSLFCYSEKGESEKRESEE